MIYGRLPTVPEYYADFIDGNVDLALDRKQCCPFHHEEKPSFSYNPATGRWSCFGKCHAHGGVEEMHRRKFHFVSLDEAIADLRIRYKLPKESSHQKLYKLMKPPMISEERIDNNVVYAEACAKVGDNIERALELDYEMSKVPFDAQAIQLLMWKWDHPGMEV